MNGLAARSPDIIKILLFAGIAYTLISTVWHFVSGPARDSVQQPIAGVDRSNPIDRAVNVQSIIGANIFGDISAAPIVEKEPEPSNEPAKETRLPLTLLGVFQAEHAEDSAAIVAQKGKAGLRYAVGQTMPGNAELVEVLSDHIILRRAGVREALRFPKSDQLINANEDAESSQNRQSITSSQYSTNSESRRAVGQAKITPPNRSVGGQNRRLSSATRDSGTATTRQVVEEYRDRLDADPEGTLNSIGVDPVQAGDAQGYKLGGLASSPLLRNTGLQSGDVLLSVNGQPVGDIAQDQLRINSVLAEGSARLEVMRGDRRFFVTAALP